MAYVTGKAQDRAIERVEEDALDRGPFIDSLIRALIVESKTGTGERVRQARGFVVGLTGKWGLGKSSVLNLLELKLGSMDKVIVAKLNPWLFKGRDEILSAYFGALRSAMGFSTVENARELAATLGKYQDAIATASTFSARAAQAIGGSHLSWLTRLFGLKVPTLPKLKPRTIDEERKALEKKLKESNGAVVVLIDELDRVEDDEVRAVAQLIKAVGDIKGISYLVAYDSDRVAEALGRGAEDERKRSGARYLEKIVQHAIPLRPLFEEDVRAFLTAMLEVSGVTFHPPANDDEERILNHIVRAIDTPREIKRLVGSFAVIEAAVRGEVNPYDVLGYCWILARSHHVAELIAAGPLRLVDDPGDPEDMRRLTQESHSNPSPADAIGKGAADQDTLLRQLFPRFAGRGYHADGDRLSRRQNLLRVLYLGNPPGMIRRPEIEVIWTMDDRAAIETALRELKTAGQLAAFIDRLDDLLAQLNPKGDTLFWPALSKVLERDQDWALGPDDGGALARDVASMLVRLAGRDEVRVPRVERIIETLIDDGDLMIVPFVLRQEMYLHGYVPSDQSRPGTSILGMRGTKRLVEQEVPRYRQAIEDGRWLRRIPSAEPVFVILNGREWNDTLRIMLTAQLQSADSIQSIASLLTPPGHIIYHETLNSLFDAEVVRHRIERIPEQIDPSTWLGTAVTRMREQLDPDGPA